MFVAGLTGGIATGKSTVSAMFRRAGARIIDADRIARQIVAPHMPAWRAVVQVFGEEVLLADGRIDRARLGALVFRDARKRRQLERIIHPGVRGEMQSRLRRIHRQRPDAVVIQDIPLLIETGMTDGLSEIILVDVPPDIQLRRLMHRDQLTADEARLRIDAQMPLAQKRKQATIVIDNSSDKRATERQVTALYGRFLERAGQRGG